MATQLNGTSAQEIIINGQAVLGIEFGSTNIKASLIGPDYQQLASGSHAWENQYEEKNWTYSREAIISGLQDCMAQVLADAQQRHGVRPTRLGSLGISAMMHGYLAFGADGELLVPFRTWRNTSTEQAAALLSEELNFNIPQRWSVAHYFHAVLNNEEHVSQVAKLNTLAGFVHELLTGSFVLGVGDAAGMFPVDPATGTYDAQMLSAFDALAAPHGISTDLAALLPKVLPAGGEAGTLSETGALLLDPTGELQAGSPVCAPEGDAGTGMVATNSVAQRTGNISAGTSIFAMVVLDSPLSEVHHEIDVVATPDGYPVAMVHCNNGASEFAAWAQVFSQFAQALGSDADENVVFETLLRAALDGASDGAGLLAYNNLSGEPVAGLAEGRPAILRTPDSTLNLPNLMRVQVYAMFATLSLGLRVLGAEGVEVKQMFAHGGIFRTAGVAQQLLAAAINTPVVVGDSAGHGGAWGIAVLAAYRKRVFEGMKAALPEFLNSEVFANAALHVAEPVAEDRAGFEAYLKTYEAGLAIQHTAITTI
ncbi:xylulokinase [Glutamicibacter sp. JC586]|uniref:xylulokinase n=1 Tax=Glutamicibacter sp. JC586 TaxID=2590552 RepID=UPI00135ACE12|nr:FGGY-family carbohydrate kinase [Glutamicibacter sp. JC586]